VYIENFLTNQLVKNFEKWSTFAKVIIGHQETYFLRHSVFAYLPLYCAINSGARRYNLPDVRFGFLIVIFIKRSCRNAYTAQ